MSSPFQTELQIPLLPITPTQGLLSRIISKHFHNTELLWAFTSSCGARERSSCAAQDTVTGFAISLLQFPEGNWGQEGS